MKIFIAGGMSRYAGHRAIGIIGWYGVAATIAAYILVSFGALPPASLWYQGLNLTGALGVTIETWVRRDYQPFWLNLIWAVIAASAIVNLSIHI
ncbi:MAG: hypothetical protein KGI69_02295 [Patescibacteria group bacterium]|nr:hypothetical protein [Patescibacteria group bacterium]